MRYKTLFKLIGFGKYERIKEPIEGERVDGYYWVRQNNAWQIAEYFQKKWVFLGDIGVMKDEHFSDIFEERIEEPPYV